ncbi:MAG: type III pantothenate kinase [Burkholderiaceae bacterium]|jgi:type III pantothenate kinase
MLLLIDAGNTRIKWALVDPQQPAVWQVSGAVPHAGLADLAATWQHRGVTGAVVANVAGAALRSQLEALLHEVLGVTPHWFVSRAECAGLRNGYRDPAQLGCDRFAAMIGARARYPAQALLVVSCGTATTIDAVSAAGDFIGGMILPGFEMMLTALARNTAQLPQVTQDAAMPALFADQTDAAILSGCLAAQTGAIERALAAHVGARCILSGGAGARIATALSVPAVLIDHLVLHGLQVAHSVAPSC